MAIVDEMWSALPVPHAMAVANGLPEERSRVSLVGGRGS